jgi:SAM-dependent methyltransferase
MAIESDVPPTAGAQLAHAEGILAPAGAPAPRDEALALLGSLLGVPTALLLARSDSRMSLSDVQTYASWVARRASGEAIAHITGHLAFMGLDLGVGRDTPLVPPGAERLVEVTLECARRHAPGDLAAAEIGTGCGAIALALAALEPRLTGMYAVDTAASALRVAEANGARYRLNLVISWIEGEGLDAVPEPVDLIFCGQCGDAASPQFARLLERAPARLRPGGTLICSLDLALGPLVAESLGRSLPGAHVGLDPPSEGAVVVIAQVPHLTGGGAALDIGR